MKIYIRPHQKLFFILLGVLAILGFIILFLLVSTSTRDNSAFTTFELITFNLVELLVIIAFSAIIASNKSIAVDPEVYQELQDADEPAPKI